MVEIQWDEFLVREHEMIERAMAVLQKELQKLSSDGFEETKLKRALDFLMQFGDKIHNKKEEDHLFPLMIQRGIPAGGPIRVMLMEHAAERELLQQLANKLPALKGLTAARKNEFMQNGLDYLKVRAEHIWKENDILYKMGARQFTDDDKKQLVQQFVQLNTDFYGPDAVAKFEQMLKEVEQDQKEKTRLIKNLTYEQLDAIMETLPFEVTFVDANDVVAYFNRLDKEKIFVRTRSVIGRTVHKCHPAKSVHAVEQIVSGFKDGSLKSADFWIDLNNDKILIRYFPVRNEKGDYLGVLEVTQTVGWIQKLQGQKRLL